MKNLILTLFLFTALLSSSQEAIGISVLQDIKLGLGQDRTHGNDTPTIDIIMNLNLEGKQFQYYYFSMQPFYEYANLYGGSYHRYGINALWNFNKLIIRNLHISPGVGIGMINRPQNEGNGSYSALLETKYYFSDNFGVILRNEWVRRSDLITPKLGYNLSLGIIYRISL